MNNESSSSTGIVVGILVIVVIAIVAWIAYTQGFFDSKDTQNGGSVQIQLGGSADSTNK